MPKKQAEKKNLGGRPKVWSEKQLQEIGKDLIEWCKQPGNWHISGYEAEKELSPQFCKNMAIARKQEFSTIYTRAKQILGNKLMQSAMECKADKWMVATLIPKYISDIDEYLDAKKLKHLLMEETAKHAAERAVNERATDKLKEIGLQVSEYDSENS